MYKKNNKIKKQLNVIQVQSYNDNKVSCKVIFLEVFEYWKFYKIHFLFTLNYRINALSYIKVTISKVMHASKLEKFCRKDFILQKLNYISHFIIYFLDSWKTHNIQKDLKFFSKYCKNFLEFSLHSAELPSIDVVKSYIFYMLWKIIFYCIYQ